jgi:hypothetical protein
MRSARAENADEGQHFVGAAPRLGRRHPHGERAEHYFVEDAGTEYLDISVLEDEATLRRKAAAKRSSRIARCGYRLAEGGDPAGGEDEAGEHFLQGRFAAAVGPRRAKPFAGADGEVMPGGRMRRDGRRS